VPDLASRCSSPQRQPGSKRDSSHAITRRSQPRRGGKCRGALEWALFAARVFARLLYIVNVLRI
jgi:hypothetical protein